MKDMPKSVCLKLQILGISWTEHIIAFSLTLHNELFIKDKFNYFKIYKPWYVLCKVTVCEEWFSSFCVFLWQFGFYWAEFPVCWLWWKVFFYYSVHIFHKTHQHNLSHSDCFCTCAKMRDSNGPAGVMYSDSSSFSCLLISSTLNRIGERTANVDSSLTL